MSSTFTLKKDGATSLLPEMGRGNLWVIFLLFSLFSFFEGVGQNTAVPEYEWLKGVDLALATSSTLHKVVISVDADSEGNIYTLSLGDGIKKYNPEGVFLRTIVAASSLDGPLDLAINSENLIHVADSKSRTIRKFDTDGSPRGAIGTGDIGGGENQFYEPTGLAFDKEDNLYIVDSYRGDQNVAEKYFLKIYYRDGNYRSFTGVTGQMLYEPYRVGVNSAGTIYVSDAANNGRVMVFNSDLSYKTTLTGMGSPGSIVVDELDFVHVVDYSNKINLSQILNYEDLIVDFPALLSLFLNIQNGINNKEFGIRIYNSTNVLQKFYKENLELPMDLTFNSCDRMYVNNGNINGFNLDFDLEIYKRTPGFDLEKPVFSCPADIEKTAAPGEDSVVVTYSGPTVSDNCSTPTLERIRGFVSGGSFPIGDTVVEFISRDEAGNETTCSFTVTVNPAVESAAFENCPADISQGNDQDSCGAVVIFANPTASDETGNVTVIQTAGPASGELFPVGSTTVTFEATGNNGVTVECSFEVIVSDTENPVFSFCPVDIERTAVPGENSVIVNYSDPTASDNCSTPAWQRTRGQASGSAFPIGDTVIEFTATDEAGNEAICSFTVTVNPPAESAVFENCPADISQTIDQDSCGAVVNFATPTASDETGNVRVTQTAGPASGEFFPVGSTTVTFEATGSNGVTVECSFQVNIEDTIPPVASCEVALAYYLKEDGILTIFPEEIDSGSTDNCGIVSMELDKINFDTSNIGDNRVTLTVFDAAGNSDTCRTTVTIWPFDGSGSTFTCKTQVVLELDETGNAILSAADLYEGDAGGTTFSLSKTSFSCEDLGENTVTLSYTGAETGSCPVTVEVRDNSSPVVLAGTLLLNLGEQGQADITPQMLDAGTTDNCGNVNLRIDKAVFSCKDIGNNQVTLTAIDESGNSASVTTTVVVTGTCEVPEPGLDFIYIYPNPTTGPFSFKVPEGLSVSRVELFDFRGRFVMYKDFKENSSSYQMDISGLLQAIYILKIYTSDGDIILRVIKD